MKRFQWTDKNVRTLKEAWDSGMSATILGAIMGVSRCAILGKARRLKLKPRIDKAMRVAARIERERVRAAKVDRKKTAIALQPPSTFGFVQVQKKDEELTKGQLRAMLTEAVRNTAAMA